MNNNNGDMMCEAFNLERRNLEHLEECSPGCKNHVTHRCEKCSRYEAQGEATIFIPRKVHLV